MSTGGLLSPIHYENRWWIIACLLLIPLPLFLPYLFLDHLYFWANPDSIFYMNVYTSYRDALWQGKIFPHWLANSNAGLGGLVFYSLSPLPYSLTAIISAPFHLSDEHQYLLGIYASQVFGAWAMWRWLRLHYASRIALAGALLYTLVPYKFIDLYQHFGLAQCWAVAFIPLWFHAAERLNTPNGIYAYALAAALCFYAHPLTVPAIGLLALAYTLHCAQWQWRTILKPLVMAHLLAFCLVASYLAAMVTAAVWLPMHIFWTGGLYNPINNLYHIDDFIGSYALLLMWLVYRARIPLSAIIKDHSLFFWSVCLIVLYIIATPLSYPLWAYVRWMDIFQFPFSRLQPGMAVVTALLGVGLLAGRRKEFTIAVAGVYMLFILLCLAHIHMMYKRPNDISTLTREVATRYHIMHGIPLPVWTSLTPNELLLGHEKYAALPPVEVKDGEAGVDTLQTHDGWFMMHIHVQSENATVVVSQLYVPAWKANIDGKLVEPEPYMDGRIKLQLPRGEHDVELEITKSGLERIGNAMTLAALALYLLPLLTVCAFKRA